MWKQWCGVVVLGLGLSLGAGCDRLGGGPGAEQREANYISGQNFAMQGQKDKAIVSFEQAVLVNPSNAAAHLALGDLYYGQFEFINAAYHYSRYLLLMDRRGQKADITAADNLRNCEMQLAVKFSKDLRRDQTDLETDALRRQIAEKESLIQRLQAELLVRSPTNGVSGTGSPVSPSEPVANPQPQPTTTANPPPNLGAGSSPGASGQTSATRATEPSRVTVPPEKARPAGRTHVVRSGDTPSVIARKYGVTVKALMAANPGLNPTRMKVGSVVKLP
jgi:LysM repeat protein